MSEAPRVADQDNGRIMAIVSYVLFLVGWPTLHLATVAAVIIAYVQRGDVRGTVWESHFEAIISTFWISLVIGAVAVPLCFVIVGIPLMIGLIVWFLYRTIRGLVHAIDTRPY
ncbi:MAG TPA: hypothetical protein VMU01_11975 [Rhizomicrobium sp.]|nr:hypothetical protein [Rhizomicrobium sp.]